MAVLKLNGHSSLSLELEKEQYEPFLDFLKGLCILWVIWEHTMGWKDQTGFWFWGKWAVPLFLLIQCFHVFKKGIDKVKWPDLKKVAKRVVIPFLFVAIASLIIQSVLGDLKKGWLSEIYKFSLFGPGGYYPLIYIQFAVVLPLFGLFCQRYGVKKSLVAILLLSIFLDAFGSIIGMEEWLWRLLCLKYLLLIGGGYFWSKEIQFNAYTLAFGVVSIVFIYLFEYRDLNLSPLFYDSEMS